MSKNFSNPCFRGWAPLLAGALGALFVPLGSVRAQDVAAPQLAFGEALERAFVHNPVLRAGRAEVEEVRSRLLSARTYPYNPKLTLEAADRSGPEGSSTDHGLVISQELELAGQRRKRVAVATAELTAAEARFLREGRLLAARVETAFAEAVRHRELLRVAETDAALAGDFLDLSQRRLEAGAATQIEVNLARATSGRAERSVQLARAAYAQARSLLAEVVAMDPAAPPEPLGDLAMPVGDLPPLGELLDLAVENRADLRFFRRQQLAAEARVRLARAERIPNLTVGGYYEREEGTDRIFGGALAISVPLFHRNRGGIAGAQASLERTRYEKAAFHLTVKQEVATAYANLQAARRAALYLRQQVIGTLDENVTLLQRSFAAGKIGATEVLIFRREFVESQREYVEALADAWLARVTLDVATGRLTTPNSVPVEEHQP